MERRQEGSAGYLFLAAALILTALAVWLLWGFISKDRPDAPSKGAVLVYDQKEGGARG